MFFCSFWMFSNLERAGVAPAIARNAKTTFIVDGVDADGDGRVDVSCEIEESKDLFDAFQNPIKTQVCSVLAADGSYVKTSILERAYIGTPPGRTSVSSRIPFQILTLPDSEISNKIKNIFYDGENLDQYFQVVIGWELDTGRETRVAKITIDWNQTFEQVSTFAAIHLNSCLEIEVATFFKKLVQEGEGIKVEYLWPDGSYRPKSHSDEGFLQVVDGVRAELQDELFDQVREYSTPVLGVVDTNVNSTFTVRANYEKQIFEKNETRYVNWNPGMSMEMAQTTVGIDCVKGGFGDRVTWNDSPACKAVLGTITATDQ